MQVRARAGKPRLQEQESFGGWPVGVMDGEREPRLPRRRADQFAVRRKPRAITLAQPAGALRQPEPARLRVAELKPALIGKGFLRRIEDLQEMHRRAAAGD